MNAAPMLAFKVEIKSGKSVVMGFEAMGPDSITVAHQHQALCGPGQYVRVVALATPVPAMDLDALRCAGAI